MQGALGSDAVLAGAIWRNIFDMNCADVSRLELMVDYTRRQVLTVFTHLRAYFYLLIIVCVLLV